MYNCTESNHIYQEHPCHKEIQCVQLNYLGILYGPEIILAWNIVGSGFVFKNEAPGDTFFTNTVSVYVATLNTKCHGYMDNVL